MLKQNIKRQGDSYLFWITVPLFIFFTFSLTPLRAENKALRIKGITVDVEFAGTPQERARGLMFRKSLSDKSGMLFLFDKEDKHSFWMKNMNFPLDIIWISKDRKIVDIMKGVSPCGDSCVSLTPGQEAQYVLEVNAGFADKYLIAPGDEVSF